MLWVGVFCLCGGIGAGALVLLTSLPPLPDCQNMVRLSTDMERLYCAREIAQSGELVDLVAGMSVVKDWPADHPLQREAQALMQAWSHNLLTIARRRLEDDSLQTALRIVAHIPPSSPVYAEAQAEATRWKTNWQTGQALYDEAQTALKTQNWFAVSVIVDELNQLPFRYWNEEKTAELLQTLNRERKEWETVAAARQLASTRRPAKLGEAIALARRVSPRTYAREAALSDLQQWSQTLLALGQKRWQQNDLNGAIEMVQYLSPNAEATPVGMDFVNFIHAQRLEAIEPLTGQPSLSRLWYLQEAIAALRQVPATSPFYPPAQANLKDWQSQIRDMVQLQVANSIAAVGQRPTFAIATAQATFIPLTSPYRLEAQTQIAKWQSHAERLPDWIYLVRARGLAQPGSIPAYRDAIAVAAQIPMGHVLRIAAQTDIAHWKRQIEIIEDQPIVDRARGLARRGRWREAIAVAAEIQEGRALYAQTRASMAEWQAEMRHSLVAEDRRILNEAIALASRTRLTRAIDLASQIKRGRPLYGEARRLMAQWRVERRAIWRSWAEEGRGPYRDRNDASDVDE